MSEVVQLRTRPIVAKLVCSACGAPGEGSCSCGVAYVPPGQRAAEAIKLNPDKSDRAIAAAIGVAPNTVKAARPTAQSCAVAPTRLGLDGKVRQLPQQKPVQQPEPRKDRVADALDILAELVTRTMREWPFKLSDDELRGLGDLVIKKRSRRK